MCLPTAWHPFLCDRFPDPGFNEAATHRQRLTLAAHKQSFINFYTGCSGAAAAAAAAVLVAIGIALDAAWLMDGYPYSNKTHSI